MPKSTVKLPRMTGQQVTVMCHLALGSRIRRDQIRATPPRYEYPLSWVLGNGYPKCHYKVATKTINALMRKGMVRLMLGEIVASNKVLVLVKRQHDEKFQQMQESWKYFDEMRLDDQTKKQIEMREAVDEQRLGGQEKKLEETETEAGAERVRPDSERLRDMTEIETYNALANRLMSVFGDVNRALQEAFKMDIMSVRVGTSSLNEDGPMQYHPQIFRLTHAQMEWRIKAKASLGGKSPWTEAERIPV